MMKVLARYETVWDFISEALELNDDIIYRNYRVKVGSVDVLTSPSGKNTLELYEAGKVVYIVLNNVVYISNLAELYENSERLIELVSHKYKEDQGIDPIMI